MSSHLTKHDIPNESSEEQKGAVKSANFIIQKYMESPLLVDNRKFDIRVWVLLAQDGKLYVFREGYVRTSSTEFSLEQNQIQN